MPLDFPRARPLLQKCDLPTLFIEELGWEPARQKLTLRAGETDYAFTAIAGKRGFTAWLCESPTGGLPDHATRLKLDRKLSETSFEHLIVFVTGDRASQSWMWVRREQGKPLAARTHEYHCGQPGDSLLQKLQILYVSLEEEERGDVNTLTTPTRVKAAFDVERVTKKFYEEFKKQHTDFLGLIDGFPPPTKVEGKKKFDPDHEWYASVMLNRLMFVYFIQRKGFLDGDRDYLRQRLDRCKKEQGKDKFYTFYRYFLIRLFHEGFGKRRQDRAPDLEKLLGNIPYLNGGLFDVHELEKPERYGKDIAIPDNAFERIFDFFEDWEWQLDPARTVKKAGDKEQINPDVLGYIFEKYINQKQMGAYYTKEDITEYISKNTVLPFLFDAARAKCKVAFENAHGPTVWDLLRENPDRYIYPAVRHGLSWDYQPGHPEQGVALEGERPLPANIAAGLDTTKPDLLERRKPWNKPAPATHGLPTEIWRETIARRQRCAEVRQKLAAGEVRDIADFITLNLDLRRFALDVIQRCESPELLRAFWHALTRVTILDPTCGSGAFLFAALNILEPLYKACLDRMDAMLCDAFAEVEPGKRRLSPKGHPDLPHKKLGDFTEILDHVAAHPNERYFIFKSIILHNLYGVDLMEEAVEICKLRLFLKLAAQVEPDAADANLGIEPLPDIDFNIRAGNTLVGYATRAELEAVGRADLLLKEEVKKVLEAAEDAAAAYDTFVRSQLDGENPAEFKRRLNEKFGHAREQCDRFLAESYFGEMPKAKKFAEWKRSHQPFHWFVEFFGILNSGGFDVIIGNPPYVEMTDVAGQYAVRNLALVETGNLFAVCMERFADLLRPKGRMGVIVPISSVSTPRMLPLMNLLNSSFSPLCLSNFAVRPGKLFVGVDMNLTIIVGEKAGAKSDPSVFVTGYNRWGEQLRSALFQILEYAESRLVTENSAFPKLGRTVERSILDRVAKQPRLTRLRGGATGSERVFYHSGGRYFRKCILDQLSNEYKELCLRKGASDAIVCLLSSSLYYWFWVGISDCYHVTKRDIDAAPVPESLLADVSVKRLATKLIADLWKHSEKRVRNRADGSQREEVNFHVGESKPILDEIDAVLAEHYGFTEEELDFIVNYDIKYRLGRDTETQEE